MREHRWESLSSINFQEVLSLSDRLRGEGFKIREIDQERACYLEEFWIQQWDEIDRLDTWIMEEATLVEIQEQWTGDFFVLAGRHHDLYRQHHSMEAYLSLNHPWRFPADLTPYFHHEESMFWIGFRGTHGFVRVRLVPRKIITPGEKEEALNREQWLDERRRAFLSSISVLNLPLSVYSSQKELSVVSDDTSAVVSVSWPDAFGPCQFEMVVADRYELLVPSARLISMLGVQPATLRTFLSGFSRKVFKEFHQLQPRSRLLYRGYLQAPFIDFPDMVQAVSPAGRIFVNLCEFPTKRFLPGGEEAYVVIGVVGDLSGYKIEVRFNRHPLPPAELEGWLHEILGLPMVYSPFPLF
ncbi:MAG: hypothetical protein ACYDBV_09875 [Nitrospiria bacterium]